MENIEQTTLRDALHLHEKWCAGDPDGRKAVLKGVFLGGMDMDGRQMPSIDLSGSRLFRTSMRGANLDSASIVSVSMSESYLGRASLIGADMRGSSMAKVEFAGGRLAGANLEGTDLSNANMAGCDLSCANLTNANLYGAILTGSDMTAAKLDGANLEGADLRHCNLSLSQMPGAVLKNADLRHADLRGVSSIDGCVVTGARTTDATFVPWNNEGRIDVGMLVRFDMAPVGSVFDIERSDGLGRCWVERYVKTKERYARPFDSDGDHAQDMPSPSQQVRILLMPVTPDGKIE